LTGGEALSKNSRLDSKYRKKFEETIPLDAFNRSFTFSLYISSPEIFIAKSLSGVCNHEK